MALGSEYIRRVSQFRTQREGQSAAKSSQAELNRVNRHITTRHQENMRGKRGTLRVLAVIYIIVTKVIFSFRKSVFRDVRTEYNLDLRFLLKFNDNGGFVVGTHKHFSWGYKKSLFFVICKRSLLAGYAKN